MQVRHGIDRDNLTVIDDDDVAAGLFDFRKDVRAEDDGVVAREAGDQLPGLLLLLGIEAGGGLVQNQHGRVVNDRLREADALPVAF